MTAASSQTYESHPIADIWPLLSDEELQELAEDIKQRGLLNPIVLYEGKILDGRNRFKACQLAGIVPKTLQYKGDEPIAHALALNEKRRHLTKSQRAALAVEIEPMFEAEAKKRQQASGGNHNQGGRNQHTEEELRTVEEKIPQPTKNEPKKRKEQSRQQAAKALDTNERYVSQAKKIRNEAPEVFEDVKQGKLTLQQATKATKAKPQNDWLDDELERKEKVLSGETVLANAERDKNLIQWAEGEGLAVRIDRSSIYGNPYVLGKDGDRDMVCELFEKLYLLYKKSILVKIPELKGKVLVCHCYPERCHGEALIRWERWCEVENGIPFVMGIPMNQSFKVLNMDMDEEEISKRTKRRRK